MHSTRTQYITSFFSTGNKIRLCEKYKGRLFGLRRLDFTWNSTEVGILPWHLNYAFTFETLIQYGLEQVGKMIGNTNGYICTEVWTIWNITGR